MVTATNVDGVQVRRRPFGQARRLAGPADLSAQVLGGNYARPRRPRVRTPTGICAIAAHRAPHYGALTPVVVQRPGMLARELRRFARGCIKTGAAAAQFNGNVTRAP